MLTEVIMPQFSLSMQIGTIVEWYKAEGEHVEKGELLCEVEGDKATVGVEAPVSGILKKIVAVQGEEFAVKRVMAYIGAAEDVVAGAAGATATAASPAAKPEPAGPIATRATQQAVTGRASPVAKRLASELKIDLALLTGTGPDGLISKDDVLRAKVAQEERATSPDQAQDATALTASKEVERDVPVTGVKKLVGERMLASYREIPHIHLTAKCQITEAMAARRRLNELPDGRVHVTVTDLLLWAASRALVKHKLLNSAFRDGAIQIFRQVNLGIAVAAEQGLIVGTIPSAESLNLYEIAQRRQEVVDRITAGKQTPADTANATFTITNLGMLGVLAFDPIVPPDNVAILGVGKVTNEVLVDDAGHMGIEATLLVTLACDHRAADGVDAAHFLADLVTILEHPEEMFTDQP